MQRLVLALIAVLIYQYSSSQEKLGRPFFTGDINFTKELMKTIKLDRMTITDP